MTVAGRLVVAILNPALSDQYQASLYCVCMTSGGFRGCQAPPPSITDTCEAPQTPDLTPTDWLTADGGGAVYVVDGGGGAVVGGGKARGRITFLFYIILYFYFINYIF